MTQTTDDPAIPQQGPACKATADVCLEAGTIERWFEFDVVRLFQKMHEFDTAFDALESALRDLIPLAKQAMNEANNDGAEFDVKGELEESRAALALAEAVRTGDA